MDSTTLTDSELIAALTHLEDCGFTFWAKPGYEQFPVMFTPGKNRMPGDLDTRVSCIIRERAKRIHRGKFIQLTFRKDDNT